MLNKANKTLKKYQPLIQTVGILLVLISVIIAIYQNYITNEQLKLDKVNSKENKKVQISFEVKYNKKSNLLDYIEALNLNSSYTINKTTLEYLKDNRLSQTEFLSERINMNGLKKHIVKYFFNYFNSGNTYSVNSFHLSKDSSFHKLPIILGVEYIKDGKKETLKKLYEYKFQVYSFSKKNKIKTIGINYIGNVPTSNDKSKSILINYINSHFESIDYKFEQISEKNIEELNTLKEKTADLNFTLSILEYLKYNLHEYQIKNTLKIKDSVQMDIYLSYPKIIMDTIYKSKRDSIFNNHILTSKSKHKMGIIEKLRVIDDSTQIFNGEYTLPCICELNENKEYHLNEQKYEKWEKMNLEVKDLLFNKNDTQQYK